jgi:hypothetical protein
MIAFGVWAPVIFHAVVPGSLFWLITQRASTPLGPWKVVGSDLPPPLFLDLEVLVGCLADDGVLFMAIEAPTKITATAMTPMRSRPRRLAASR